VVLSALILDEANIAFELNTGLFTTLRAPSSHPNGSVPDIPVLGDPTSPTLSSTPSPAISEPEIIIPAPSPLQLLEKAKREETGELAQEQEKGTYPLSSVIAFIAALCISHFVLTVGGFTGAKGFSKLESVLESIANILGLPSSPSR
jgi:heme oxygenase (biliverdin-producing, ferredoxin)